MSGLKNINFLRLGENTTVCFIVNDEGLESVGHFIQKDFKVKKEDQEYNALKNALENMVAFYGIKESN